MSPPPTSVQRKPTSEPLVARTAAFGPRRASPVRKEHRRTSATPLLRVPSRGISTPDAFLAPAVNGHHPLQMSNIPQNQALHSSLSGVVHRARPRQWNVSTLCALNSVCMPEGGSEIFECGVSHWSGFWVRIEWRVYWNDGSTGVVVFGLESVQSSVACFLQGFRRGLGEMQFQGVRASVMAVQWKSEDVRNALAVVVLAFAASSFVASFLRLVKLYIYDPIRISRIMTKQGVKGPPFIPILGSAYELAAYEKTFPDSMPLDEHYGLLPTVKGQFNLYFPRFGKRFIYYRGPQVKLVSRDPQFAKEVLSLKYGFFERHPDDVAMLKNIVGLGLDNLTGEKWAIERRTLNSFFYQDVLKALVEDMVKSAECEMEKWEEACRDGSSVEISVEEDLNAISNNIIAHTAFRADREKAKEIYRTQRKYVSLLFESLDSGWYWIPGFRYFPTGRNRAMAQLKMRFDSLLHEVIIDRQKAVQKGEATSYGNDLLGVMLAAASDGTDEAVPEFNLASVFNNTKLFFFAGQDTVASALTFTLLQLARYPEWQDRARQEVLEVTGDSDAFDSDAISRLKIIGMILNETMRVFPVISSISKVATKDMQIGDLFIPRGLVMEVPLAAFNQDPEIWGEDVHKFNPERFENGVAKACTNPQAFMPFAIGPKSCIGKDFAMMEAKIVIAMVLRRFQLSISPNYKHHPCHSLLTKPKYGLQLILSYRS